MFDFVWTANERNFALLMRHRGDLPKTGTLGYWCAVSRLVLAGLAVLALPIALVVVDARVLPRLTAARARRM